MRIGSLSLALCLLSAGAGADTAPGSSADAKLLAERLDCRDCPPEAIAEARRSLRQLAAGPTEAPETRAAVLALAEAAARGEPNPEGVADLMAAVTLYPEEPAAARWLPVLAQAQLATGDALGAHFTFVRWLERGGDLDPQTRLLAAENAVGVGDEAAAFRWIGDLDAASLPEEARHRLARVRLRAATALGRDELARQALHELSAGELARDAEALLAAAQLLERAGESQQAASLYERFANVYLDHARWAEAAVALGRVRAALGQPQAARASFEWVLERAPGTLAADRARFALARLDAGGDPRGLLARGLAVAAGAATARGAEEICCALLDAAAEQLGPLAAAEVAGRLAAKEGFAGLAARKCAAARIQGWAAGLLEGADTVRAAALARVLADGGFKVPRQTRTLLDRARASLGLVPLWDPARETLLAEARAEAAAGRWEGVHTRLAPALASLDPTAPEWAVMARLAAEARWRLGERAEALAQLEQALSRVPETSRRPLLVLRADLLFASRAFDGACAAYAEAARLDRSPWVDAQLARCHARASGQVP